MRIELYETLRGAIADEVPAASATVIAGSQTGNELVLIYPEDIHGSLGDETLNSAVVARLKELLVDGGADSEEFDGQRVFMEAHLPPPHLVVIGAVHTAIPLISI